MYISRRNGCRPYGRQSRFCLHYDIITKNTAIVVKKAQHYFSVLRQLYIIVYSLLLNPAKAVFMALSYLKPPSPPGPIQYTTRKLPPLKACG